MSTDGVSPVRADGSEVGSTIHEEVGSRGHSDGSNDLVEQRISFLLDPAISYAFPISTSTSPTSAMDNATRTTVRTSVRHRSAPSTSPIMCSTACDAATIHSTQPRAVHVPLTTVYPATETTRRRRARRDMVQSPSVPDGWTEGAVLRDGSGQVDSPDERSIGEVPSLLRDGQMVVSTVTNLPTGPVEEMFQTRGVESVVMEASSAGQDGLRTAQSVPSDAQLLCWTLVDDGVVPAWWLHYTLHRSHGGSRCVERTSDGWG